MAASSWATSGADPMVQALAADRSAVDRTLAHWTERYIAEGYGTLGEAIRYSLLGPGKRLRPLLLLGCYRAVGGRDGGDALPLAVTVEVVHAYSLVHDDLPCMDDDAIRRGRPTTHRVFGPPVAAVAGVAMVALAVRWAVDAARGLGLPHATSTSIVEELMRASGGGGMVGGQLLDLAGEGRMLTEPELMRIHTGKTASLIAAAARIGGMAGGCDAQCLSALGRFGGALGLAFQVADDVLDATATTTQLGKTAGADAARRKSTYASLLGVDGARGRARELVDEARGALADSGLLTPVLDHLAQFAIARTA